jgi:hypothetical protein
MNAELKERWNQFWFAPESAITLGAFRILYGLVLLSIAVWQLFPDIQLWYGPQSVISFETVRKFLWNGEPRFDLLFDTKAQGGFDLLFNIYMVSLLTLTLGLYTRVSALIAWLCMVSFHHHNPLTLTQIEIFFRTTALLLVFSPAGKALSLDNVIQRFREPEREIVRSGWPLVRRILQLKLSLAYFCSFAYKLFSTNQWLDGSAVYYAARLQDRQFLPLLPLADNMAFCMVLGWLTLLVELAMATLVWSPRLRYPVLACAALFHLGLALFLTIPIFQLGMISALVLFVPPADLQLFLQRLRTAYQTRSTFRKSSLRSLKTLAILFAIFSFSTVVHLWGLRQDLPWRGENDEGTFIGPALQIALFGDLNPHQFINPGSTLIYPLALLYTLADQFLYDHKFFFGGGGLPATIWDYIYFNPERFHMPARILSMLYSLGCLPVFFFLCRNVFNNTSTALIGTFLLATMPLIVEYGHIGRTDTAALFFALLSLLMLMRWFDRPSRANQILSAVFAGLAISSRYFMVSLLPCFVLAELLNQKRRRRKRVLSIATFIITALASFAISSPFVWLDFGQTLKDLSFEATSTMVGSDGLSVFGNLKYYLTDGIVEAIFPPLIILALIGGVLCLWRRDRKLLVLMGFALTMLIVISMNPRHWPRWLIPIVPIVVLLAANAINWISVIVRRYAGRLSEQAGIFFSQTVALALIVWAAFLPINSIIITDMRLEMPSTQVGANQWIEDHLSWGSGIVQDMDMVRIDPRKFRTMRDVWRPDFVRRQQTFVSTKQLVDKGYRYVILSDVFDNYVKNPGRFPDESRFYSSLLANGKLIARFEPRKLSVGLLTSSQRGGTVRLYDLLPDAAQGKSAEPAPAKESK